LVRASKDKMKVAVELVTKGATILGEPCPQCGGIQVRYHGRVYCTGHEDLSAVVKAEVISLETVVAEARQVVVSKLKEATMMLGTEKDNAKQDQLVSLMTKYVDLLQKLPQK
jgi:UPF0148 protein